MNIDNKYSVVIAKIPNVTIPISLMNVLPHEQRVRCMSYRSTVSQMGFLLARILCWNAFAGNVPFSEWIREWKTTPLGKPSLGSNSNFSISRSGLFVAVGFGPCIGVDLQQKFRICLSDYLIALSPVEKEMLDNSMDPESLFFNLWTKKEAVLKAAGTGIKNSINSLFESKDGLYFYENIKWKAFNCLSPKGFEMALAVPFQFSSNKIITKVMQVSEAEDIVSYAISLEKSSNN
jgi:4'-phosphopantetheinyl transferase